MELDLIHHCIYEDSQTRLMHLPECRLALFILQQWNLELFSAFIFCGFFVNKILFILQKSANLIG